MVRKILSYFLIKSKNLFQWFFVGKMKGNADKCHFICNSNQKVNLTVENEETTNNICEKLLGIKIYSKIVLKCTRSISVYQNQ